MENLNLDKIKRVHFIGIGGIGVSAIARMMMLEGKVVSGSDQVGSLVTEELAKLGAAINIGHNAANLPATVDLVIYSIAVPPSNPEFAKAQELGIMMMTYPEALGEISRDKYTIAVSGTHGKTTTTGMLAKIFIDAGLEPTVVVGSFLKDQQSNFVAGTGHYLIAEACEYRRSFLNLYPKILIITNLKEDHLDYYRDLADIQTAFRELARRVPSDGFIICNLDDVHLGPVLKDVRAQVISYPTISTEGKLDDLTNNFPGAHNRADAQAAWAGARVVGVVEEKITQALNSFTGTWRRFDYQGRTKNGAEVYDDYAHHPDEVRAVITAAREKIDRGRIVVAFQPHLYSRTTSFLDEFVSALLLADEVVLLPIYAARELDDGRVNSEMVAEKMKEKGGRVTMVKEFKAATKTLLAVTGKEDIILVMGAGDINKISKTLVSFPVIKGVLL